MVGVALIIAPAIDPGEPSRPGPTQPAAELGLIVLAEPAEPPRASDLRPVVLERAPGPLVAWPAQPCRPQPGGRRNRPPPAAVPRRGGGTGLPSRSTSAAARTQAASDPACRRPARARPARPTSATRSSGSHSRRTAILPTPSQSRTGGSREVPGMGGDGNIKVAGLLGLYLGFAGLGVLLLGALLPFYGCLLAGVGLLVTGRGSRRSVLPFGPFLLAGALSAILIHGSPT